MASTLLVAALLKCHALATGTNAGAESAWPTVALVGLINWEFWLAIAWLCRPELRLIHGAATFTFFVFAMWSLGSALAGRESCDCFGPVRSNNWLTSAFDLTVVAILWKWRPTEAASAPQGFSRQSRSARRLALVGLCVAGVAGNVAMLSARPRELDLAGNIQGNGGRVHLSPLAWVGQRFPLTRHIDGGERVTIGRWTLLLVQHNCQRCQAATTAFCADRAAATGSQAGEMCAVVAVPISEQERESPACGRCAYRRLTKGIKWSVRVPVRIELADGVVTGVEYPM